MGKAKTIGGGWLSRVGGAAVLFVAVMFVGSAFSFKITFNPNGGKLPDGQATSDSTKADSTLAKLPSQPTLANARCNGWFTTQTGGVKVVADSTKFTGNVSIFAQWTKLWTVTFNANAGADTVAVPAPITEIDSGTAISAKIGALPELNRDRYEFAGWTTSSTGGTVVTDDYVVKSSLTIYAKWTPIVYKITLNPNGGTVKPDSVLTGTATGAVGRIASALPSPTRSGYTFDAWYTEENGGDKVTTGNTGMLFNTDATIYAHWKPLSYTITYNLNGGAVDTTVYEQNPKTYTMEDNISLNPPTRRAFEFAGWTGTDIPTTSPELSVNIAAGSTGNRTYTATWTVVVYTISFDYPDTSMTTGTTAANAGKLANLPKAPPAAEGYTFDGWYKDVSADSSVKISTNYVFDASEGVYARWMPVSYKITYNLNGGTVDTSVNGKNPAEYTTLDDFALTNPTKRAHTFVGWTGTGIAKGDTLLTVTIAQGDTGAKTFTANWSVNVYEISFDDEGNTVTMETGRTSANAGKLTALPTPGPKSGYIFEGWFTEEGDSLVKVSTNYVFNDDALVVAVWTEIYIVTFDAKGGTVSPATARTGSGGKLESLPTPVRAGYLFDGWYTDEFDDEVYGSKVDTGYVFDDHATLYAGWADSYTVTFGPVANGKLTAKVDTSSVISGGLVSVGKNVVFTAVPDSGYTVKDWKVDGAAVPGASGNTYTLTGVKTAAVAVNVTFEKVDGVASPDRVIPAGSGAGAAVIAPAAATAAEFTAGPNPVGRSLGSVNIFRQGLRAASGTLYVYDASGNFVNKIAVGDKAGNSGRRTVASWNLSDAKGRPVPEGTYLIKGTVKTAGGYSEKVSVVVGVR